MDKNLDLIEPIIDWLTYRSYEHNRLMFPQISVEAFALSYNNAYIYEKIFKQKHALEEIKYVSSH